MEERLKFAGAATRYSEADGKKVPWTLVPDTTNAIILADNPWSSPGALNYEGSVSYTIIRRDYYISYISAQDSVTEYISLGLVPDVSLPIDVRVTDLSEALFERCLCREFSPRDVRVIVDRVAEIIATDSFFHLR